MRRLTGFILILLCTGLTAQSVSGELLKKQAKNCSATGNKGLPALVDCLTKGLNDDEQKVLAMAYWITDNITYDVKMFQRGSVVPNDDILRNKRGVCSDYSKLFRSMCVTAGIECYVIDGYSKGLSTRPGRLPSLPNHAWNVVFIDDEPRLLDLTWASGTVDDSKGKLRYVAGYNEKMIFTDPAAFADRHLPADPRWQFTEKPISLKRFFAEKRYAAMVEGVPPTACSVKNLANYRQLDKYGQKADYWESAHGFHPSHENLRIYVESLLNNANRLSTGVRVEENLNRAIAYCLQAHQLAEKNKDWRKRKFYMATATQGMKYAKYRMDNPGAQ